MKMKWITLLLSAAMTLASCASPSQTIYNEAVTASPAVTTQTPATTNPTPAAPSIEKPVAMPHSVQSSSGTTYILNTNTKKFHLPSCSSVNQMKDRNKRAFTGTRDEAIAQGYNPCKRCNP